MTSTSAAAQNGNDIAAGSNDISEDDEYYMELISQILDTFPKSGPPSHPGRVSNHIYIGNQDNADDLDLLPALGITHVLNMAGTRNFDTTRSSELYISRRVFIVYLYIDTEQLTNQYQYTNHRDLKFTYLLTYCMSCPKDISVLYVLA